jgi:DNA-binding beta-propeller fold protein YncE
MPFRISAVFRGVALLIICLGSDARQSTNWTLPQHGWLYVIDTNKSAATATIHLVDPTSGIIRGGIATGYLPLAVLSPDGSRLYVASIQGAQGSIIAVDTATGTVVATAVLPNLAMYIDWPTAPSLAVSTDGKKLFVERLRTPFPGNDIYSVSTIDTTTMKVLPDEIQIPNCGLAWILSGKQLGWDMAVFCGNGNYVKFTNVNSAGAEAASTTLRIPDMENAVGFSPANKRIAFVGMKAAGQYPEIMRADGAALSLQSPAATAWSSPASLGLYWIPQSRWQSTDDGARVFVGMEPTSNVSADPVNLIGIIENGNLSATISTTIPIWSLAKSPDSRFLYGLSPQTQSISVLDTQTLQQVKVIPSIGNTPTIALIAP